MSNVVELPRGIRNNNPGNIRKTITHWKGEVISEFERSFESFDSPGNGIRAIMLLLLNYYIKYQLNTVQAIINRWAPPHENDTGAYAEAVAGRLGVKATDHVNFFNRKTLLIFTAAIVIHENGRPPVNYPEAWYAPEIYETAADAAYLAMRGKA